MKFSPYLMFNGDCKVAFEHYEKLFNGKIAAMLPYSESPEQGNVPEGSRDKIMHSCLMLNDQMLMGSDATPGCETTHGNNVYVCISFTDAVEAERIYQGLSEGANIQFPIGETFWAKRYGMLTDRFGVSWMINCPKQEYSKD